MKLLGHRLSYVGENAGALAMSKLLMALGLTPREIFAKDFQPSEKLDDTDFAGAIFASDDNNWVELWAELEGLPKGLMLQLVVDDADALAAAARANGIEPHGPVDVHGERIYYIQSPIGMPISFQSRLR